MKLLSIQEPFLNILRKEKISVSIYLLNGVKIVGIIESFDYTSILIKNKVNQLINKHALATIVPSELIKINFNSSELKKNNEDDLLCEEKGKNN